MPLSIFFYFNEVAVITKSTEGLTKLQKTNKLKFKFMVHYIS